MNQSLGQPSTGERQARWATAATFFVAGALLASWAPHIPTVQTRLGIGPAVLGLALLSPAVGGLLAMRVTGALVHRHGSGRVTHVAAVGASLLLPLPVLAPSLPVLVAGLLAFGALHGAMDVAMNAQGVTVEDRYRRPIMSSLHAQFSIGALAGAGLATLVLWLGFSPTEHVLGVSTIAAAVVLAGGFRLLPDHESRAPEAPTFARPRGVLLVLGLLAVLSMLGEGAMLDWSAVYMRSELGSPPALAAGGFAAFSLTMALGRLVGDRAVHRLGDVAVLRGGTLIAALGLGAGLLLHSPLSALGGFACVGIGLSNVVPVVFAATGRVPGVPAGYGLAAVSTIGYFGFLVGPPVIGLVAQSTRLSVALGIVVVLASLIAVFAHHIRVGARPGGRAVPAGTCGWGGNP